MRLVIIIQSYGRFGGAERSALAHFSQLKKMGIDVSLFFTGTISPEWKKRLARYSCVRILPSQMMGFSRTRSLAIFLRQLDQFDKIVIHHHVEPGLAFCISKLYGKKTVWYSGSMFEVAWEKFITGADYRTISPTVRMTSSEFYGKLVSRALLSKLAYNLAVQVSRSIDIATVRGFGKIVANSNYLSRFLTKIYKLKDIPPVVYPAVDPMIEELSMHPDQNIMEEEAMMVVGPLIPLKNVDGIINAASFVPSAKLVLIGEGQERKTLKELASHTGVSIEFRGTQLDEKELAAAYTRYSILVHLSLYEPFGLTPLEAGLFSKPCIVTSHGGPSETVIDGQTGYVVDPRNTRLVAARMEELLGNPELRREMGKKARKHVTDNFSLELSAKRLLAEIDDD